MDEIKCVFCEKDMSDEKFREDYTLEYKKKNS